MIDPYQRVKLVCFPYEIGTGVNRAKIAWFGLSATKIDLLVDTFRIRQFYTKQITNDVVCNLGVEKQGHRSERQAQPP